VPTVQVPIKRRIADIPLPVYHHEGDAGLDIRSGASFVLKPGERRTVKTGLQMALPKGTVGLLKDRSGVASRSGLHTLAGVIDSNYRGEIKIVLINLGKRNCQIRKGDRIAQLLILPCFQADLIPVSSLPKTLRNKAGFGSSGKK